MQEYAPVSSMRLSDKRVAARNLANIVALSQFKIQSPNP